MPRADKADSAAELHRDGGENRVLREIYSEGTHLLVSQSIPNHLSSSVSVIHQEFTKIMSEEKQLRRISRPTALDRQAVRPASGDAFCYRVSILII